MLRALGRGGGKSGEVGPMTQSLQTGDLRTRSLNFPCFRVIICKLDDAIECTVVLLSVK